MARVVAEGLGKRYGAVVALADVGIALHAGEVHAIVGENGAGKSTLAKCIAGAVKPDSGRVLVDGEPLAPGVRRAAIAAGIGYVPQALSLVGALSLTENLLLGRDAIRLDHARARADLSEAARRLGVTLPLEVPAARLALAEQQLAEIALALAQGARILLLDEPTSMLGPLEVERLRRCLRELAAAGTAIGLVTHRIVEVLEGSDRVTVLRGGARVFEGGTRDLTVDALARMMVGDRSRAEPPRGHRRSGNLRLRAIDLTVDLRGDRGATRVLEGVSFDVAQGEIVGVAGVASASQPALAEALAGIARPSAGRIEVNGTEVTGNAALAERLGVAWFPDDRARGLVAERTVADNAALPKLALAAFRRFGLRRPALERAHAGTVCESFHVQPPNPALPAGGLSGGNQQKLMVGRELAGDPAVVIAHGPTQGLDLAAAAAIRNRLAEAADRGAAVVVISADLDEVLGISDRIVVLAGNRVSDVIDVQGEAPDMARLGRAMAGAGA